MDGKKYHDFLIWNSRAQDKPSFIMGSLSEGLWRVAYAFI